MSLGEIILRFASVVHSGAKMDHLIRGRQLRTGMLSTGLPTLNRSLMWGGGARNQFRGRHWKGP